MRALPWLEKVGLIIAALIALVVSVADLVGALSNLPWLANRIPEITLLLLALLIMFLAFQERDYSQKINNRIQESTARIIETMRDLPGIGVLPFQDEASLYNYVADKLRTATKSVDDITWGFRKGYRTATQKEAYNNYMKAIETVCKKGTVTYREVSSLADEHYFKRAWNLVKKGYYSYHLGYYDISQISVPLISYVIIDSEEVIVGFYRVPLLPSEGEVYLRISQPLIVKLFKDYFDTLWVGSTKIKEAATVRYDIVNHIKKKLNIGE